MVKISVITVCFNAASTLEKTILSVLDQTYPNIEYIIIDGGSTDGSVDIIKKYADQLAYWVSEPDNGIYDAMNKGKSYAQGDFLIFLGADDVFFSNEIISVITPLMNKQEIYYGDSYMTKIRKIYWGKFNKYKLAIGNICHQAIFYPKNVYVVKDYDVSFRVFADYVYNLTLYPSVPFNYLNETISIFNYDGISCYRKDLVFESERNKIIKTTLGLIPLLVSLFYKQLVRIKKIINLYL